jgi:hypothetical protein
VHTLSRILGTTLLLLVVVVNAGIALAGEARGQTRSDAIPRNYRELIARYVLALGIEQTRLGTAMIATPYDKPDGWLGRLTNTTVPVVCVSFTSTNIFGRESKSYLLISFENGKPYEWPVHGTAILASECGAFSVFTEVMKR